MRTQTLLVIFDYAVRSTLVLGLAGLACLLLRRRSAAARHLVWAAALASLVALPLLKNRLPGWRMEPQAAAVWTAPLRTVVEVSAGAPGRVAFDWLRWIWLAGAAAGLMRMALGQYSAWRLVRGARPEAGGRYRLHGGVKVPVVCGILHPVVVLPEDAPEWPAERLRSVIAHEEMHVARRDTWTQGLAQLACALYWPQPLVWLAAAELRKECEQAADDGVLASGTKPSAYAGHLVEIARQLSDGGARYEGGIAMTRTTQLERRIAALLHPTRDRRDTGRGFAALVTGLAVVLLVTLAAVQTPLLAQQGRLSGIVKDASGAVVPKARIDVRATPPYAEPRFREIIYTNEAGEFSLDNVPDGAYDITVAKPGFARLDQIGLAFQAAKARPLDLTLNLGMVQERMQVQAQRTTSAAPLPPGTVPQRINVGGNVQQANLVYQAKPTYPPGCKLDGVEGTVIMKAIIGRDGAIVSLEQVNKQVDERLVQAAREAVQQWRYKPTLLNGNPVEVATEIEVNFTLMK